MGKCYCDYCDVFLTNDSVAVRKQHNDGNRHKYNVCQYYRNYMGQQLQEQIDDIVQQFEIKVARGLVRPTYGLPPAVKAVKELERSPSATQVQDNLSHHPKPPSSVPNVPNTVSNDHMKNNSPVQASFDGPVDNTSSLPTTAPTAVPDT